MSRSSSTADHLGRSLLVTVDAHDRLQGADVALRSVTEPIDTSSPSGRLIFRILASFAEYERETIRQRTRAGMHRAFRSGRHFGVAPYGYRADEHGHLQIVPEEAAILVQSISAGKRPEDGRTEIQITYRFGSPARRRLL